MLGVSTSADGRGRSKRSLGPFYLRRRDRLWRQFPSCLWEALADPMSYDDSQRSDLSHTETKLDSGDDDLASVDPQCIEILLVS